MTYRPVLPKRWAARHAALAVSPRWSAALVWWKSPPCYATVCLPTNYRDWTSIKKCQSAALIQNYLKVWSIICMHSYLLKLNESFMTNWWRYNSVTARTVLWKRKREMVSTFLQHCTWILLSFCPHTWTSLFHFQTLTALTLTRNIGFCQSNLTSYRERRGSIGGEETGWCFVSGSPQSTKWIRQKVKRSSLRGVKDSV